jgi:hypothetical protein
MPALKKHPDELRERALRLYRESDPKPEFGGDGVEVGLVVGDVGASGWVFADPSVGVFVCAAFPGAVGGVHLVCGLIGQYYWDRLNGPGGAWGFPRSDEYEDSDPTYGKARASDFEGGTLRWTPASGVLEFPAGPPDWTHVEVAGRMRYVVDRLVRVYGYPVNGVAGMVGCGSTASMIEPLAGRPYFGGVTTRTALRTVLRDNPSFLAVALIAIRSPRCR